MASQGLESVSDLESGTSGSTSKLTSAREAERSHKRAEEHRRAGKEWFERALHASNQGANPFHPTLQQKRGPKTDKDFAAFGQAFNKVKLPVYVAVLIVLQAAQPILVKNSLRSMRAPAILVFLHMLAAAAALWVASNYDLPTQRLQIDKLQLNVQSMKGAAVPAALGALQTLFMFSALHHNSVLLVLGWMLAGEQLLEAAVNFYALGKLPSSDSQTLLTVALGATVLELLWDGRSWVGLLMLLLWAVTKAAECAWKHLKADPHAGGRIASFYVAGLIREYSDEGEALKPPTLAFLSNILPAGPVLLLGFIGLEGKELASHEPSVPAVSAMLLACGCYVLITLTLLLLGQVLQPMLQPGIKAGAAVGTLLMWFMVEEAKARSLMLSVLFSAIAGGASLAIPLLQKQ